MNRTPLVALLAIPCLALLAWLLFGGDGDATLPANPSTSAPATAKPEQPAAAPVAGQLTAEALQKQAGTDTTTAERSEATPATGAASANVMVRGRLVDKAGAPRANTALTCQSWPLDGDLVFDMPDPDRVRDGKQPSWTTGADGRFAIPLAANHAGALELLADDVVFVQESPRVSGKQGDQDLGDVKTLRANTLRGVVQDQAGKPVADAKVGASRDVLSFNTNTTKTGSDGTFTIRKLQPGKWSVRTASGKFLPTTLEVTLAEEEDRSDLVLVVKPGNAIAGQVVDERGIGVADFKVGSKRTEARGGVSIERFAPDEATTTDGNGYFTLSGLSDETATVRAFGPGHSSAMASDVKVGTGDLVLRVERFGAVEGVLVDAEGKPIEGSSVRAQTAGMPEVDSMVLEDLDGLQIPGRGGAKTAADGSFRLEGVRPGAATIVATGRTHRPARQAGVNVIAAQTTKGVRLLADRGAVAKVTVVDDAGKPVAKALVTLGNVPVSGGPGGARVGFSRRVEASSDTSGPVLIDGMELGRGTTDENGVVEIAGLAAGDVMVAATHAEFAPAEPVRCTLPRSGTTESTVKLRVPGRAEITVLGSDGAALAGSPVRLVVDGDDGDRHEQTTDEHGIATFAVLVPGNYQATLVRKAKPNHIGDAMVMFGNDDEAIASSQQRLAVKARETTKLTLNAPLLAKLHGVVTGVDGPVAGCVIELQKGGAPTGNLPPGMGGRSERTDANGEFAFDEVESGDYTLRYGKPEQQVRASHPVSVPLGTPDVRQDLALRTGKLRARIVAAGTGEPISGAEVEVVDGATAPAEAPRQERRVMMVSLSMMNDGGGESTTMTMGDQRAKSDADGEVEIDDVPAGEWKLQVKHKRFKAATSRALTVVERQVTEGGRIEMTSAGQVRGKVLQADGKQARLALVTHRAVGTEQWSQPEMAQGGNFRVGGLAPGKYLLRAQALNIGAEGGGPGSYSPEVEVDVKGGETATVDLQLPAK